MAKWKLGLSQHQPGELAIKPDELPLTARIVATCGRCEWTFLLHYHPACPTCGLKVPADVLERADAAAVTGQLAGPEAAEAMLADG